MSSTNVKVRSLPDPATVVPEKLAHFVLKTNNYEPMVDWYKKVLNARVVLSAPHISFLTFDDEHHRIAITKVPRLAPRDPNACGTEHVAFTFRDLGSLLANYKRVKASGILPSFPINHGNTISLYYDDPDGNRVELQVDSFPTAQELQDYLENDPDYASNPLGAPFDPEVLLARYEAGEPLSNLIKVPPLDRSPMDILQEMGLGPNNI
ncbi:VOC family protein [Sphingobium sp. HWE2-09]|uniref:VOC family protein n=1 Tax=Sphingobium sp. HWE2-09 TaxID=3108390 RepID=UPI002DC65847|nr:VOC family protein [Sphingobium sp. HWE2-09]